MRPALRQILLGGRGIGGIEVAFLGDSRTATDLFNSGLSYGNRSFIHWARLYSLGAFDTLAGLNFGVSGDKTSDVLARMRPVLSSAASVVVLLISTNDLGVLTYTQTTTNLTAIIAQIISTGRKVVLIPETPRIGLSGQNLTDHLAVRDWCRAQVGRRGVVLADCWNSLATAASGFTVADASTVIADGLHPSVEGARIIGQSVAAALAQIFPSRAILPFDNTVWTSGPSLGVNLVTNALCTGVGGTTGGSPLPTGNVANNWFVNNNAGGTVSATCSKVVQAGYEWQQVVISGTPSGAGELYVRLEQFLETQVAALHAGDTIQAGCLLDVDAGASGVRSLELIAVTNASPTDGQYDSGDVVATYQLGASAYSGVLLTLPYVYLADPTVMRIRLRAVLIAGTSAALSFRATRAFYKKVA